MKHSLAQADAGDLVPQEEVEAFFDDGAQIVSFDDPTLPTIPFEETQPARITSRFLNDRDRFLRELLEGSKEDRTTLFE